MFHNTIILLFCVNTVIILIFQYNFCYVSCRHQEINTGKKAANWILENKKKENQQNNNSILVKRSAALKKNNTLLTWPNGTIPYTLSPILTVIPDLLNNITMAMKIIETVSCIKFKKKEPSDQSYLFIETLPAGCFSNLGYTTGISLLNLQFYGGPSCYSVNVIIHELLHTAGVIHEHQRPDRDEYVTINWSNIKTDNLREFQKYKDYEIDTFGMPYDYNSIMHYKSNVFVQQEGLQSITALGNGTIGNQTFMTPYDIMSLRKMYNCSPPCIPCVTNINCTTETSE